MKKICLIIAVISFLFCNHTYADELKIGGAFSPPYLFEENGKMTGIDAEIIKYIFNKLGVAYNIKILPWQRCLSMLEKGQLDIGIAVTKNYKYEDYFYYPSIYSRNEEFMIFTNAETKANYDATSLSYIRENGFKVGIIRGQSYNNRFWEIFPWNIGGNVYNTQIETATNIENNLKKLDLNRINAFPCDRIEGMFTARKLGLKNVTFYDFVSFFNPIFSVFSRRSDFKSDKYPSISALMKDYERELHEFQQRPEYNKIFNWDWNSPYSGKIRASEKETLGETINIGFLAPLSGPAAGWGKPGLTGNQIFIDEINAGGGLLVGSVRYPLKMHTYDDEADGAKASEGARELVETHNVKFISSLGGVSADATHPYLTDKKVIFASLIATDIRPDRPYLLAGGDVTPRIDMLRPWYHKNKNPKLKRWAVVSQNDPIGVRCQAWEVAAAVTEGWDVVYDRHFSTDTKDFSKVVADILSTKPDVVSLNLTWQDFAALILEQLYIQGYKGEISGNYMVVEENLKKVPLDYHENIVDGFPDFNDPFWGIPSIQHEFYDKWITRYGPGASKDVSRKMVAVDWDYVLMLKTWAFGVQLAESFDPDKIIHALRDQKSFPTLLGNAMMAGEDMWGIQNMVSPPIPITETRNGIKRIQTIKRFEGWFEPRKDNIIKIVKSKGMFWSQQKDE